jgi:hypothetical protein
VISPGYLTASGDQFCSDAKGYVDALDRYGKVFTDNAATVGDIQTRGEDSGRPRIFVTTAIGDVDGETALAAAERNRRRSTALVDAIATASSVATSSTTPGTTTTPGSGPRSARNKPRTT